MPQTATSKPVVAIDIDDVLYPFITKLAQHHNHNHGTDLSLADFKSYIFHEVWGGSMEQSIDKVNYFFDSGDGDIADPIPDSKKALKKLSQKYELAVITARLPSAIKSSQKWLEDHYGGDFGSVHFANYYDKSIPRLTKAELCKQINAIWLIDDSLRYITECAEAGINCILFGNYPWNQKDILGPNITRVEDWVGVEKQLL